jgi:hypothetical protein
LATNSATKKTDTTNHKRWLVTTAALILVGSLLFTATIQITNAEVYSPVLKWGKDGSSTDAFEGLEGVALDPTGNNVYAGVFTLNRISYIEKFTTDGNLIIKKDIGTSHFGGIVFYNNRIYIADGRGMEIHVYDGNLNYLFSFGKWMSTGYNFGVLVDPRGGGFWDMPGFIPAIALSGSYLYVLSLDSRVIVYNLAVDDYILIDPFATNQAVLGYWGGGSLSMGITINSGNHVFVGYPRDNYVQKFTNYGQYEMQYGNTGSSDQQVVWPTAIAFGPNGDLFVSTASNLKEYTNDGVFVANVPISGGGGTDSFAFSSDGFLYMASGNFIFKYSPSTIFPAPEIPFGTTLVCFFAAGIVFIAFRNRGKMPSLLKR